MRFVTYLLVAAAVTLSSGCGGDDTSVSVTIPPELCAQYEPSELPAPGKVVTRLSADSVCEVDSIDFASVEVVGTDIAGVFAVAAHVQYDSTKVGFVRLETTGSALAQDGTNLLVRVEELPLGELTVGVARNASTAVNLVGTQLLMTLVFAPVNQGAGEMTIETPCLTDGAEPPQPLGSVTCSGGSFSVVTE